MRRPRHHPSRPDSLTPHQAHGLPSAPSPRPATHGVHTHSQWRQRIQIWFRLLSRIKHLGLDRIPCLHLSQQVRQPLYGRLGYSHMLQPHIPRSPLSGRHTRGHHRGYSLFLPYNAIYLHPHQPQTCDIAKKPYLSSIKPNVISLQK